MPTLLKSLPNPFAKSTASSPTPKQIRNKFYKSLREFTAWQPWGTAPDHSRHNDNYIPITGAFVKRCDYPAKLQQLIDFGWKAAATPKTARTDKGPLMGAQRSAGTIDLTQNNGPMNPLRKGFGRPMHCNWDHITKFEQVAAYAFRGDTRPPEAIQAAGGYSPPSTRTDSFYQEAIALEFYRYMKRKEGLNLDAQGQADFQLKVQGFMRTQGSPEDQKLFAEYHFWRQVLEGEQMHLKGMTNDSFLKAYISTTRDINVAREGSSGVLGGAGVQQTSYGWVYVLRVDSGFLLKKGVGGISKLEGEISHLGPIPFKNVYGFIGRHPDERTIYIRNMFDQQDYEAFKLVLASLSSLA